VKARTVMAGSGRGVDYFHFTRQKLSTGSRPWNRDQCCVCAVCWRRYC